MLETSTHQWFRSEGETKKYHQREQKNRGRNSYLSDVAVRTNISTLAGKKHHTHYFGKGKHALSTEPFQILHRPTQQSCTSRFLTEGNPDVMNLLGETPQQQCQAPSLALLSTQAVKKCLSHVALGGRMRIGLTYVALSTNQRMLRRLTVQWRKGQRHYLALIFLDALLVRIGFCCFWPASTKSIFYRKS